MLLNVGCHRQVRGLTKLKNDQLEYQLLEVYDQLYKTFFGRVRDFFSDVNIHLCRLGTLLRS